MFEPQKFFIGVMDFFSILLPGAILTWLMKDPLVELLGGKEASAELTGAEQWVAFGVVSYLAGHLLFLIGSWLDVVYDVLRRLTRNRQVDRILRGDDVSPRFVRMLVWLVFKRERDLAVDRAGRIKKAVLAPIGAGDAVNTFQWSKAFLNAESPSALAAVQRVEADSKFFRCFTVLLVVLLLFWSWWQPNPVLAAAILIVLLPLSFWRFMDQRYKATNQAYWFVIAITAKSGASLEPVRERAGTEGLTHAGGIIYREGRRGVEYLLIERAKRKGDWVEPQTRIEVGERAERAAVRGVHEQTGVWAMPLGLVRDVRWRDDPDDVVARFFVMQAVGQGRADGKRRQEWRTSEDARAMATFDETKQMLAEVDGWLARVSARPAGAHISSR